MMIDRLTTEGTMIMIGETTYYGIYVQREDGHFWITDETGGDRYCGTTPPTDEQINDYRNLIINA